MDQPAKTLAELRPYMSTTDFKKCQIVANGFDDGEEYFLQTAWARTDPYDEAWEGMTPLEIHASECRDRMWFIENEMLPNADPPGKISIRKMAIITRRTV